jgi:hypothetical protein
MARSRRSAALLTSLPAIFLCAVIQAASPGTAFACSICRCGDPTFNALGKDGFAGSGLRVSFDSERFDKTEGAPSTESESQVENRMTAMASYGFCEPFSLFVRVPVTTRSLTTTAPLGGTERIRTTGLSDPEIFGKLRLWASPFSSGVGRRASLSATFGVKTPWGQNNVTRSGERVDEHAQPGTGSTDAFAGLAFLYLFDAQSAAFVSASYRQTGSNRYGYRYGNTVAANAAYERKLGSRLDGVVEVSFRNAGMDRVDPAGTLNANTGGALLYVTPHLLLDLGRGIVLRAAAQIPTVRSLHGYQRERVVLNAGLTFVVPQ